MEKRASKTAYFLNRSLGYLALIGRNVRLPELWGVWVLVADAERAPWEVTELLVATYPGIEANRLPFVALLTDFDVDEFEHELRTNAAPPAKEVVATEEVATEDVPTEEVATEVVAAGAVGEAAAEEDGVPVLVPETTR
jgi:hypothetical protein